VIDGRFKDEIFDRERVLGEKKRWVREVFGRKCGFGREEEVGVESLWPKKRVGVN
jgi:hypothetical protein